MDTMKTTDVLVIKKLALLFLVVGGLFYAKAFLMPLCIGAIIAALFLPFCKWMERHGMPAAIAVLICFLIITGIIGTIMVLMGGQLARLTDELSVVQQKTTETIYQIQEYIFSRFGISPVEQAAILASGKPSLTGIVGAVAASATYIFSNLIMVIAYVVFLIYYRKHIKEFIIKITVPQKKLEMALVLTSSANVSQQYLIGLSKMIGCLWVMYGIGFSVIGVKNAIFFAVLCGLLEIIPFVGNITGTIITVAVAAFHGAAPLLLLGIVITYGSVQFIQGWVLEPLILGPQVKINPLFTIIALVLGQLLWGIPGIILAIPVTAIFKIFCDHFETLKPYGFLIGEIGEKKAKTLRS